MTDNVMAIDQGTTGTTVLILDRELNVLAKETEEFRQIYPRPGWVEHDPDDIWRSTISTMQRALGAAGLKGDALGAIGITNQRETTVVWDRDGGRPIHNAIVWQCRRTAPESQVLKDKGLEETFVERSGLVIDAYFSGTKVAWILDRVPGARARADQGELAFGTIDSFLVNRLTGGVVHVTDVSNASRTMLFNVRDLAWDPVLCEHVGVPMTVLPEIRSCAEVYGETLGVPGLPDGIPIAGMAGDQQAALFGQACFDVGQVKCTYGTGAFMLVNTGSEPRPSHHRLLTTVGWKIGDQVTYTLEGSAFIAGAAVQWLRDGVGIIEDAPASEAVARSVTDSGGVVFVPALAGLGAPHWRPEARGAFFGITRGTTAAHLTRAVLEGVALQIADILRAMADDLGEPLAELRVDGGASNNDLLMQFQADVLDLEIVRPKMVETTALGAAFLAGLGAGIYGGLDEIKAVWSEDKRFAPGMDEGERAAYLERWADAISRC